MKSHNKPINGSPILPVPTTCTILRAIFTPFLNNRHYSLNIIFLSFASGYAESLGISDIYIGVNSVDYSGYPDCRPDYLKSYQALVSLASKAGREGNATELWAPLIYLNKVEIIQEAYD